MHIQMLRDFDYPLDEDGNSKRTLPAGVTFDVSPGLARKAIEAGAARPFGDDLPAWAEKHVEAAPITAETRAAALSEAADLRGRLDSETETTATLTSEAAGLRDALAASEARVAALEAELAAMRADLEAATAPSADPGEDGQSARPAGRRARA